MNENNIENNPINGENPAPTTNSGQINNDQPEIIFSTEESTPIEGNQSNIENNQQNIQQTTINPEPPVNNPNLQNQNQSQDSQKNNKDKSTLIIVGAVVGFILIAIIIKVVAGIIFPNTVNNYNPSNTKKSEDQINKNYKLQDYVLQDGKILVEIKNENSKGILVDLKVEYYDENKNIIDIADRPLNSVAPKSTTYVSIYNTANQAKSYNIKSTASLNTIQTFYNQNIEFVSQNETDGNIIVQYKNNSKTEISNVDIGMLFYDENNKIIDFESKIGSKIAAGNTESAKIMIPYDNNTIKQLKYGKAKPVVLNAFNYNYD